MKKLQDRTAVVTGAGSGIGRATALELARRGMNVVVTDLDVEKVTPVAAEIEELGRKSSAHGFDVAKRGAWPGFLDEVIATHGSVQLLMNNAGVALTGPFLECSVEDLEWQLDVNLRGVMYGCYTFLPHLLEQDEAHLVNVSSIFGIVSMPDNAAYCMSKHAVRSLTESLEQEHWESNVRFSSIHPGAVATNIVSDGRFRAGGVFAQKQARKAIDQGIPPEQAANIIVKGIQRNERRILVGRDAHFLARIYQAMPVSYRNVLRMYVNRLIRSQ
ncbi:MAG: SDR family oxidoreductase [Myxococcota bacterium]